MPSNQQPITTEADVLISLLKSVKEISFKDAAQQLHIPLSTLEAWATFMEEEGLISIKYKFTTPYLSYEIRKKKPSTPDEESFTQQVREIETQTEINRIASLLNDVKTQNKSGDFAKLPSSYDSLLVKIRLVNDSVFEKFKHILPEKKQGLQEKIKNIQSQLTKAHALVDQGLFNEAHIRYDRIHIELEALMAETRNLYLEAQRRQTAAPEHANVVKLLDTAYNELKIGNLERAKEIHSQLSALYAGLPHDFADKKRELEHHLAKLTKDLATGIDRSNIVRMQKNADGVSRALDRLSAALKARDLAGAEQAYKEAKKTYDALPDGFFAEKRKLQEQLIRAYEALADIRQKIFSIRLQEAEQKTGILISRMDVALAANDVSRTVALYRQMKETFENLPPGFLTEKLTIQARIMAAYSRLMETYRKTSVQTLQQETENINTLLQRMETAIRQKNPAEATTIYHQMRTLYQKLPAGFLTQKTAIENKILALYEALVGIVGEATSDEVQKKIAEITEALDEGFGYAKQQQYDLAQEIYTHIVKIYNSLPPGFSQSKSMVRSRMLALYKELALNMDQRLRSQFSRDAHVIYHEILKHIVAVRHYIAKKQFDLLEPSYHGIKHLFSQLPVGFVQQKSELSDSIRAIGDEVELYQKIQSLPQLAALPDQLRAAIGETASLTEKVATQCKEDIELVLYARELLSTYKQRLAASQKRSLASPVSGTPSLPPPQSAALPSRLAALPKPGQQLSPLSVTPLPSPQSAASSSAVQQPLKLPVQAASGLQPSTASRSSASRLPSVQLPQQPRISATKPVPLQKHSSLPHIPKLFEEDPFRELEAKIQKLVHKARPRVELPVL